MSNTITAYFKGRVGVAEAVYQNDYGIVMNLDSIDLPAHFDCYFSTLGEDEAIPGIGADNQVAIPNGCLSRSGSVTLHIPLHTGANDSEVEYIVYFKVIGRARPVDDGTPVQMTAIEQALALLQNPIGNIEQIVNEALAFTGDTFAEMRTALREDYNDFTAEVRSDIDDVEDDFTILQGQFDVAVAAVTTDTEVTDIRMGDDGAAYTTAGASVRKQLSDLKEQTVIKVGEEEVIDDISNAVAFSSGYMSLNGTPTASDSYKYTSKIPVKPGDTLSHGTGRSDYRFVTAYNGNTAIESKGATFASTYIVPDGVDGVVLSLYNDSVRQSESIRHKYTKNVYKNLLNYVTPEMFGAIGDGSADDTEAVQNAFDSCDLVFFMSGKTYKVTDTIDIDNPKIVFGNRAKVKYTGNSVCFNLATPESGVKRRYLFHGIEFEGANQEPTNEGIAIKFNGNVVISTVENCTFRNLGCGIEFSGSGSGVAAYGCLVSDCDFWRMSNYGIYAHHQSEQLQIKHCWFNYGLNNDSCGIRIDNSTSTVIDDCVIQSLYNGVELRGCKPAAITNCHFEVCSHYSIYLKPDQYQNEQISIIGNYIAGGATAIMMENGEYGKRNYHTLFLNNVFTGQSSSAIDVVNSISSADTLIVGCAFANDHSGTSTLVGASVKGLTITKDENDNVCFVNNNSLVGRFVGDTLHLKKTPVIES